jgi:hypothetical protein
MNSNTELRKTLQEITLNHPSAHPRLMHERTANHSIKMLSAVGNDLRYNCVMFALGAVSNQQYIDLINQLPDDCEIHADTKFLQYLIEQGQLIPDAYGNLIIYSNDERITHIGKIDSIERVISKWGVGHLYDHAILEVPEDYGNHYINYRLNDTFDFMSSFAKYLEKTLDSEHP